MLYGDNHLCVAIASETKRAGILTGSADTPVAQTEDRNAPEFRQKDADGKLSFYGVISHTTP